MLPEYLADVARRMRAESESIRRDFATHRPSAGTNREDLVEKFMRDHLPGRFGISSGLVISHDGKFSNQADLLVVDSMNNAPLYGTAPNPLWPVEAVYALVEVKTNLSPAELRDAVAKARRFKTLPRRFAEVGAPLRISASLFAIWAFDCPAAATLKENVVEVLADVPRGEQPDLIIVPDRIVGRSGAYLELANLGEPGSPFRARLEQEPVGSAAVVGSLPPVVLYDLGENSLLAFYVWLDSWLRQAGGRFTTPTAYLPPDAVLGQAV